MSEPNPKDPATKKSARPEWFDAELDNALDFEEEPSSESAPPQG
jgi:hypothetical protein